MYDIIFLDNIKLQEVEPMKNTPAILTADRFFRIFLSGALTTLYYPMEIKWNVLLNIVCIAANIFCTCTAVGLIWIPKHNVKFISLLKSLKTICYTYSISLLLLCVVLILSSLD